MSIHKFAVAVDNIQHLSDFVDVATDFRTDVEQRHTLAAVHNSESPDIRMARALADEIINISGGEIKVYIRTDNADIDTIWDEDPDPTYWNCELMKAYYKPQQLELELKKWGPDIVNKTEVVFSHRQLFEKFGSRMLRSGDVLRLQYGAATDSTNPKYYRVINASPSGNFKYIWLYFTCTIESLSADVTVRPLDSEPMPIKDKDELEYHESI